MAVSPSPHSFLLSRTSQPSSSGRMSDKTASDTADSRLSWCRNPEADRQKRGCFSGDRHSRGRYFQYFPPVPELRQVRLLRAALEVRRSRRDQALRAVRTPQNCHLFHEGLVLKRYGWCTSKSNYLQQIRRPPYFQEIPWRPLFHQLLLCPTISVIPPSIQCFYLDSNLSRLTTRSPVSRRPDVSTFT